MIAANQARENVLKFNGMVEESLKFEKEIDQIIQKKSKIGETKAHIILMNNVLRQSFVDEMISLGYECSIINIAGIKTLVVKWG